VSKLIAQSLYRVRLGAFNEEALAKVDRAATVVFAINHRSNADFLLVTYLASTRSALSYAVGEWARIWPLSKIIRAMGAYFIRRRSRNALYRKVLARYVRMSTDAGVTQAIFLEGGLSLDGKLAPPKLGLLSYIVNGFDPGPNNTGPNNPGPNNQSSRDVVFIPVGLNYDRVLEDRVLISAHEADGTPRFPVNIWTTAAFVLRLIWRRLTGRYHRFGYACVSFGEPLSLKAFLADASSGEAVAELGAELSTRIGQVIPVLPVSLVASVFLTSGRALSMIDVKVAATELLDRLHAVGAHSHVPRASLDYAVEVGMRMLTMRGIVTETEGMYAAAPDETGLLHYYANAIAHLQPDEPA
jgi:glycerol-3-phosphate O-acyltransferase